MQYNYSQKLLLDSKIAHEIKDWATYIIPEWVGGVNGSNIRTPYYHMQNGEKVIACDEWEPTNNTEQAFQLMIDFDLLGSNIGYLMAAGVEVEDKYPIKDDPHSLARLAICEAALACNYRIQKTLEKHEYDYAY